eukprot:PITA_20321
MASERSNILFYVGVGLLCMIAHAVKGGNVWQEGNATLYGDGEISGRKGDACGYSNLNGQGYGKNTVAVSSALLNDGRACGACYQIECNAHAKWCLPGSVNVTATNLCVSGNGVQCKPPFKSFFLPKAAFLRIVKRDTGSVPVKYRRVPCTRKGGIRFTINGDSYFNLVLLSNVGGAGDVQDVFIKGSKTNWQPMSRNWGQIWLSNSYLDGQSLSFNVTTSDGKSVVSNNVAPPTWKFGQTFEGAQF